MDSCQSHSHFRNIATSRTCILASTAVRSPHFSWGFRFRGRHFVIFILSVSCSIAEPHWCFLPFQGIKVCYKHSLELEIITVHCSFLLLVHTVHHYISINAPHCRDIAVLFFKTHCFMRACPSHATTNTTCFCNFLSHLVFLFTSYPHPMCPPNVIQAYWGRICLSAVHTTHKFLQILPYITL